MFITATAMVCPVGLSAASACAAKRAGISAFEDLPYHDNAGDVVVGAAVTGLDWTRPRASRLLSLLTEAMEELLDARPDLRRERVPVLVCLAETGRPGGGAGLAESILQRLTADLGVEFDASHSNALPSGHTAGFEALAEARRLIRDRGAMACVICAVDSYVNASTLHWLDRHYRLKTPSNRDGVIPGEAAAAIVIEPGPRTGGATKVVGLGFARELAPVLSDEPLLGRGLTDAARSALGQAGCGLHEIDVRLSDVTGESYGFKELPLLEGRLLRVVRKEEQPLWHWSEAIGDSGAAAGIAQLVLADDAFRKGYAPGSRMLCLTSAVGGARAAAVLRFAR